MAYSTANPPALLVGGPIHNGAGLRIWGYASTDALAAVRVAGYFTNGYDLGMRAGDFVLIVDTDAVPLAGSISMVNAATAASTDLADGLALASTDTD